MLAPNRWSSNKQSGTRTNTDFGPAFHQGMGPLAGGGKREYKVTMEKCAWQDRYPTSDDAAF